MVSHHIANTLDSILNSFQIYRNDLNIFKKNNSISKNSISKELFSNIIKLENELKKEKSENSKIISLKAEHPDIIIDMIERCKFLKKLYKTKKERTKILSISN